MKGPKKKKGWKGRLIPYWGKAQGATQFFPSPAGEGQEWGSICPEKRCQLQARPCSDHTLSPCFSGV